MKKHRLNILPEMQQEAYSSLKNDIEKNGFDNKFPIYIYQDEIIDGWNRFKACKELKVTPIYKNFTGSSLEALTFILRTNNRRDLSSSQRACLAADSDEIIETLTKEIEEERRKKISEFRQNEMAEKIPPSKKQENEVRTKLAQTFGTNSRYVSDAQRFKKEKPEVFEQIKNGTINISEAKKEEKKEEKIQERKKLAEEGAKKKIEIDFRLGDFEEVFADLPDGSIDCIITDPPYPYEFIEVWTKLSRFAKRVLKPNGYCIAYSGQMYLPEVMQRMSEHLDYYWTFAVYHEGQTQIVNGINLMCRWKPVLIFQNGKKKIENTFQDYFISENREKNGHDWQQSKSGVGYLIEMFTKPMDTILEPFAGSGTTIIAATEKKRKVLAAEINEDTYNIAKALL
jgi:DNA modification methylase